MAFKISSQHVPQEGRPGANPTLLEPIMKLEIFVPEESMGM